MNENNETLEVLKRTLKISHKLQGSTRHLRQRWVVGASEWMAGKHGSLQNLKQLFSYSDSEWKYIWSSMIADGAWSVPSIKDSQGNDLKENYAPEIMIKYIAHDIQCHLLIIDLRIGTIQYCSANYLKKNNVAFESLLLLYATGNHFQSVIPCEKILLFAS